LSGFWHAKQPITKETEHLGRIGIETLQSYPIREFYLRINRKPHFIERRSKMIIALRDVWTKFEKYAQDKGYTKRILTAYVLCNQQGNLIKLISIRSGQHKMVIWEDNMDYYEMDI
jgi:hypothetical protein